MKEQPHPTPNDSRPIVEQVIEDLRQRAELGERKYGVRLQAHNGRSALQDAYEEALDLAQYLKQEMVERAKLEAELAAAKEVANAAAAWVREYRDGRDPIAEDEARWRLYDAVDKRTS